MTAPISELFNLRHLRVFLAVAQQHSIQQASAQVFLSQPAMTQAIGKLEQQLDCALFIRQKGMHLTPAGQLFAARVERALDYLNQGMGRILGERGEEFNKRVAKLSNAQLKTLLAVYRTHNYSLAAKQLNLSQPSVYRAIHELEKTLGVVLFKGHARGVIPSKVAKPLSKIAKLSLQEISQGVAEVQALKTEDRGITIIGGLPLSRIEILPRGIEIFQQKHPEHFLKILTSPYSDLLTQLLDGDVDLIIGALRDPLPSPDVIQRKIFSTALSIVASSQHPLVQKDKITLEDLQSYPWVVANKGAPTRASFETLFQENNLTLPCRIIETNSQILIRQLLLNHKRLALVSHHQMQIEIGQGILYALPIELNFSNRAIGLTWRRDWLPTAAQQYLIDSLLMQMPH